MEEFRDGRHEARRATGTVMVHVETESLVSAPDSDSWWDAPVAEIAEFESTQRARTAYEAHKTEQRRYLAGPPDTPTTKDDRRENHSALDRRIADYRHVHP